MINTVKLSIELNKEDGKVQRNHRDADAASDVGMSRAKHLRQAHPSMTNRKSISLKKDSGFGSGG